MFHRGLGDQKRLHSATDTCGASRIEDIAFCSSRINRGEVDRVEWTSPGFATQKNIQISLTNILKSNSQFV